MKMNRLEFSIDIKAGKEAIWNALWSDSGYRDWCGVFFEGSNVVTDDWKEGSTVMFLSPDQSGIYSTIEKHIPNKIMQFKHCGMVTKGEKQPVDEKAKEWAGAMETYTLTEGEDVNTLTVEIDVMDEHLDFMKTTFPKALEKLKDNCS